MPLLSHPASSLSRPCSPHTASRHLEDLAYPVMVIQYRYVYDLLSDRLAMREWKLMMMPSDRFPRRLRVLDFPTSYFRSETIRGCCGGTEVPEMTIEDV